MDNKELTLRDILGPIEPETFVAVTIPAESNWIPAYIGERLGLWERDDLMDRKVTKIAVDTYREQRGISIYLQ